MPFKLHVCVNGREMLARQMGAAGSTCYRWLDHREQAPDVMVKDRDALARL